MDNLQTILTIVASVLGFVVTVVVPLCVKAWVAFRRAKADITRSAADKLAAEAAEKKAEQMFEMTRKANEVIESLEKKFEPQDRILKSADAAQTLGAVKKECALAELSEFAAGLGAEFDRTYWAAEIDELVRLTRNVNKRAA